MSTPSSCNPTSFGSNEVQFPILEEDKEFAVSKLFVNHLSSSNFNFSLRLCQPPILILWRKLMHTSMWREVQTFHHLLSFAYVAGTWKCALTRCTHGWRTRSFPGTWGRVLQEAGHHGFSIFKAFSRHWWLPGNGQIVHMHFKYQIWSLISKTIPWIWTSFSSSLSLTRLRPCFPQNPLSQY